ncbi:MAG: AAA family ATPase [Nitrospirales bacterium]|nr:AAA family ATPase [Nitrospirales bacterium]
MTANELKARVSIETVYQALGGRQGTNGYWHCLQPERHNNGDRNPSVQLRQDRGFCWSQECFGNKGADIFALVQIVRQCSFAAANTWLLESFQLKPALHSSQRRILRRYQWTDHHGQVAWHLRWSCGNKFSWSQDSEGKTSGLGPCQPTCRNLDRMAQAPAIILCAGERDQDTLNAMLDALGLEEVFATTPYTGESAIRADVLVPLHGKHTIYLSGDNDLTGHTYVEKCGQWLEDKVGEIKQLSVPEGSNDWTDWKTAGGTPEAFLECLQNAAHFSSSADKESTPTEEHADVVQQPLTPSAMTPSPVLPLQEAVLDYSAMLSLAVPERACLFSFLPVGGSVMPFGPRGVGKTFFNLSLTASLCTGTPFLRWAAPEPTGVLYVDGEMDLGELRARMTALLPEPPKAPLRFLTGHYVYTTLQRDLVLTNRAVREEITHILDEDAALRVLILDNISCLFSGIDENRKQDWEPIAAWLVHLRHRGITVVLVHHGGKGGQQRGTSGREDALDTVIKLSPPTNYDPKEGCHFELGFTKCRSAKGEEVGSLDVRLQEQQGRLSWVWKPLEVSKEDQARTLFEEGMTSPSELANAIGITRRYASKLSCKFKMKQGCVPGGFL